MKSCNERKHDLECGISIEVVWFDIDIIELQVSGFNGYFAGSGNIYVDYVSLPQLAKALRGFPISSTDVRHFDLAGIHLQFVCRDSVGHVAVEITISSESHLYNRKRETATFWIELEPASIDDFVAQLSNLTVEIGSVAHLKHTIS